MDIGIVIAAGSSRRFGVKDKLLAAANGHPLAAWAAAAMRQAPVEKRVAVAIDPAVAALFGGFEVVPPDEGGQQADSLRAGFTVAQALGAKRVVVALADMPAVTAGDIAAILSAQSGDDPSAAWDGRRALPPAAFPAAWFPLLRSLQGDRGAGALLLRAQGLTRVPLIRAHLIDIDTPEDLTLWMQTDNSGPES